MSLVSSYVQSQSGKWYQNPAVRGDGWFVCWDDDDPIELVVKKGDQDIDEVITILKVAGWEVRSISEHRHGAHRCFSGAGKMDVDDFHAATSCFVQQVKHGPPDSIIEQETPVFGEMPKGQGVYFVSGPGVF